MVLKIVSAHYGDHSDAAKVADVTDRIKVAVGGDPKQVGMDARGIGWGSDGLAAAGCVRVCARARNRLTKTNQYA